MRVGRLRDEKVLKEEEMTWLDHRLQNLASERDVLAGIYKYMYVYVYTYTYMYIHTYMH